MMLWPKADAWLSLAQLTQLAELGPAGGDLEIEVSNKKEQKKKKKDTHKKKTTNAKKTMQPGNRM